VVAGYSDNGKDNNIKYNFPPEVLELLKARALEYKSEMQDENALPPGFELAIEDKYGNVRRVEKGDLRQLHDLGGMTLVIILNEVHEYNGTKKEAEDNQNAPQGSVNIRDVISNDILFNLREDPLILPLRHQSISSSLGHPTLQYLENPLINDFAFFDGLSPKLMLLSQELGKNPYKFSPDEPRFPDSPALVFSPSSDTSKFAPDAPPHNEAQPHGGAFSAGGPYPSTGSSPDVFEPSATGGASHANSADRNPLRSLSSSIWQGLSDENADRQTQADRTASRSGRQWNTNQTSLARHLSHALHTLGQKAQTAISEMGLKQAGVRRGNGNLRNAPGLKYAASETHKYTSDLHLHSFKLLEEGLANEKPGAVHSVPVHRSHALGMSLGSPGMSLHSQSAALSSSAILSSAPLTDPSSLAGASIPAAVSPLSNPSAPLQDSSLSVTSASASSDSDPSAPSSAAQPTAALSVQKTAAARVVLAQMQALIVKQTQEEPGSRKAKTNDAPPAAAAEEAPMPVVAHLPAKPETLPLTTPGKITAPGGARVIRLGGKNMNKAKNGNQKKNGGQKKKAA
jgi:hypothetical protein